jgi:hypothetical protein
MSDDISAGAGKHGRPAPDQKAREAFAAHVDDFWQALEREFLDAIDRYHAGPGARAPLTCDIDVDVIHIEGPNPDDALRVELDRTHRSLIVSNPPVTGGRRLNLKAGHLGITLSYGEGPTEITDQVLGRWLRRRERA